MATPSHSVRPLAGLKQAVRQCRAERRQRAPYATAQALDPSVQTHLYPPLPPWKASRPAPRTSAAIYPSLEVKYPFPSKDFRTSQAIKQNRFDEGLRPIRVHPATPSTLKSCPDAIAKVTQDQINVLDPTGVRTRLFAPSNPDRVQPGDILHVRLRNGDPFSGVCMNIRQRHQPIDTAILLRNQLTRIGVEMWFKVYSPNVEAIEVVQRKEKRARRAKLYYLRLPKHDMGSVDALVRQYQRQKLGGIASTSTRSRDAAQNKKKKVKKASK